MSRMRSSCVYEADADRVDAPLAEPAGRIRRVVVVERADLAAVDGEPAPDRPDPVGRHDPGRLHPEIAVAVAVRNGLAGDLEHVLVALGGDEAEVLDLPLEQLVGRNRRAVADGADGVATLAEGLEDLLDTGEESFGRVARRGGRLRRCELSGPFVDGDDVGERAPRVDADPDSPRHHTPRRVAVSPSQTTPRFRRAGKACRCSAARFVRAVGHC
jgi:hypothetical protein